MKRALAISTIVLPVILIATTIFLATRAHAGPEADHRGHWVAPGQWQMNDIGRNHGVVTEPGMPKCNPWVSPECARLYPSLFKRVPQPRAEGR
jgi:hypothetical protein